MQELIGRAIEQRVRIYIWYISSGYTFESLQADQLEDLAAQTGGSFLAFSAEETIPSPEIFLNGLRNIYRLIYTTQIASAGNHRLAVEIQNGDRLITTLCNYSVGETAALEGAAGLVQLAPDRNSKIFMATQVADEARHLEVFLHRLRELGVGDPESEIERRAQPALVELSGRLNASKWPTTIVASLPGGFMNVMGNVRRHRLEGRPNRVRRGRICGAFRYR